VPQIIAKIGSADRSGGHRSLARRLAIGGAAAAVA
jgi:hypothetical protein